eukprot:2815721-Pyramimonas_sp.AAC.1
MSAPSTIINSGATLQGRRTDGVTYSMRLLSISFETLRASDSSPQGQPSSTSRSREASASTQCWVDSRWPGWKQTQQASTFPTSRSLL